MHEMGIVIHLAKTLDELAEEHSITRIGSVTLSVGEVSGIVEDLFIDAWNYFRKKHPVLHEAELKIEQIPAVTHCGSKETWLVQGNECIIKEIEAETAPEDAAQ